jgi:hypothetical protein
MARVLDFSSFAPLQEWRAQFLEICSIGRRQYLGQCADVIT